MPALPIIIVAQILTAILIVNSSLPLKNLSSKKAQISKVLGIKIAQVDDQSVSNPTDNSADQTQPTPDNTQPPQTEITTQPSENTTSPTEQSITPYSFTADNPSLFSDQLNPNGPAPTASDTISVEQPSLNQEASAGQTAAVLNPSDVLNSMEEISQQSQQEVAKEEQQINQTTDIADQTKLLINFSIDKIKDINDSIKSDDFATTNFASQRFNYNLDRAINNLQNLPVAQAKLLQKQLTNLCNQADFILKSAELSVPEEAEQDLEINRAKCLNLSR